MRSKQLLFAMTLTMAGLLLSAAILAAAPAKEQTVTLAIHGMT
ncbi:MAG TPA: hypothetical protein VEU62_12730 [Bryobacterales bacterium]|nr:hypothetical protein [Bryobacterales bacterium]